MTAVAGEELVGCNELSQRSPARRGLLLLPTVPTEGGLEGVARAALVVMFRRRGAVLRAGKRARPAELATADDRQLLRSHHHRVTATHHHHRVHVHHPGVHAVHRGGPG